MNKDKTHIEIGDHVSVNFNNSQYTLCPMAEVINKPCATGDSWVFKDLISKDETIHYVSEGCTVTLLEKGKAT